MAVAQTVALFTASAPGRKIVTNETSDRLCAAGKRGRKLANFPRDQNVATALTDRVSAHWTRHCALTWARDFLKKLLASSRPTPCCDAFGRYEATREQSLYGGAS